MRRNIVRGLARRAGYFRFRGWLQRRFNHVETLRMDGRHVRIPCFGGIACLGSEAWMSQLLAKLLGVRQGAFIDVGVNVGQTLIKVKSIEPERQYIGFEPNPDCVFYVQRLIKENGFAHCQVLPIGLFTEDRILALNLFQDESTDSSGSLIAEFRAGHEVLSRIFVPVFRYESVAEAFGDPPVGLVKIDVEGAEQEVLESLQAVIQRDRPVVLLEVLPSYSEENAFRLDRQRAIEKLLKEWNYDIYRVVKTAEDDFSSLDRIDGFGIHSDLRMCDYVAAPAELRDVLHF